MALATRTLPQTEESLSIYLVPEAAQRTTGFANLHGGLRIKWRTTELSTGWRVEP